MCAFIFVLLFNLLPTEGSTYINGVCVDCDNDKTLVPSGGSSSAAPLLRELSFSFVLVEPNIKVDFVSQSTNVAMSGLQANVLDFVGLDYPLAAYQATTPLISNDLQSIPIVAMGSVVTYNLPQLNPEIDPPLVLSRQNIYDILYGSLTSWNDNRLVPNNPFTAAKLPNETISLVLRTDPSGTTGAVMTMLQNMQQGNSTGNFCATWPTQFLTLPHAILVQGSSGVIAAITSNPYSLGFVAQSYVDDAGLPDAKLQNRAGFFVQAGTDLGVYSAIVTAGSATPNMPIDSLNPADMLGDQSYPLALMIHLVYHTHLNKSDCVSRIAMMKYIHWMLTNDNALEQIYAYSGFIPLPTFLVERVLGTISTLKCNGLYLLQENYQDFGNDALTEAVTILSIVLIVLSAGILSILVYNRQKRITQVTGLVFVFFFLFGCIFNYLSAILWATIPTNTSICIGRFAFVSLGYSCILGAMFAKCWQVSKSFASSQRGRERDINPFKELSWRAFFFVITFEVLSLIVWLLVDPPVSVTTLTDDVNLLAIHECTAKFPTMWYGLQFSYFGILLIWGAYLAYVTRDIWAKYNYPNESRSFLMSIYNIGFCCVILVPLVTGLDASPQVLFFLVAVAIIFPTTFALVVIHGPKLLVFVDRARSQSRASGGGNKTASTGTGHETLADREDGAASRAEIEMMGGTVQNFKVEQDRVDNEQDRADNEHDRKESIDDPSGRFDIPGSVAKLKPRSSFEDLEAIAEVSPSPKGHREEHEEHEEHQEEPSPEHSVLSKSNFNSDSGTNLYAMNG